MKNVKKNYDFEIGDIVKLTLKGRLAICNPLYNGLRKPLLVGTVVDINKLYPNFDIRWNENSVLGLKKDLKAMFIENRGTTFPKDHIEFKEGYIKTKIINTGIVILTVA